jgi:hypothetical protein
MVADAMELNRFPPDSRPLTREMTDMIRPYSRHEYPMPIRRKLGKGERLEEDQAPFYLLTGPRYLLTRGDPLEARLEVYRGNPAGQEAPEKIPVEIVASQLFRFGQPQYTLLGKVPMNDEGAHGDERGGDLVYGVAVNPGDLKELAGYNGLLQLVVDFRVGSIEYIVRATLDFMLTSREPARYSGVFSEKLTPQGLEITAQVEVFQGGLYFLQGLLFDAKNNPIGFSIARPTWEPGKHGATFSFFGLLFHEAQAEGPYVLRTLTGARLPADGEPFKVEMPPFPGEYRTRAYKLSEFSGSEYESPQKDKHLQDLQELADKNPDKTPAPAESQPSSPGNPPAPAPSGKLSSRREVNDLSPGKRLLPQAWKRSDPGQDFLPPLPLQGKGDPDGLRGLSREISSLPVGSARLLKGFREVHMEDEHTALILPGDAGGCNDAGQIELDAKRLPEECDSLALHGVFPAPSVQIDNPVGDHERNEKNRKQHTGYPPK